METGFGLLFLLTEGKLVVCPNQVYAGSNKTKLVYTHPENKQCNYSVDTSNLVTKEELEKVKGMIDVSARIVDSGRYSAEFSSSDKNYSKGKVTLQLPECDYVELESAWVDFPYTTAVTSSEARLTTDCIYVHPAKIVLVAGGHETDAITYWEYEQSAGSTSYSACSLAVSLSSSYILTSAEIEYNRYNTYRILWYYTCYKYNS